MAKKDSTSQSSTSTPKRRWYHNYVDAYKVTRRTYKWFDVAMIGLPIVLIALGIILGLTVGPAVLMIILGIVLAILMDLVLLSQLVRPAMFTQLEGQPGAVYAVLTDIRRGWVIEQEPVAANRNQDLVWRLIGRPGVVLITEGPTSRVMPMVNQERKAIQRIVTNAPIHVIQVGNTDKQIALKQLPKALQKLPKELTKVEVPAVAERLRAVQRKGVPVPKGIDPNRVKPNARRALRG